ncbi:Uncharacterised protein [Listeria grayi]|uniref:Uncharacterized protein n=1 Tax=Listeria grayi FSL F6-1183 TaxID=1265827 RepID=A0A829R6R4_LISGR|nr:hypothetical protein [Listeria grayi]EUJ27109.1 hypothetical protein LMUR_11442 [Listeria grayi FSL F6-1183]VEI32890.1 Uncharacterised protein [Listeria grayi]
MKKMILFLLSGLLLLLAWFIFSAFQPAIIIGESDNWKAAYKPRKGMDGVDTERYPWNGKITWQNAGSEPEIESVDLLTDNKYQNKYMKTDAEKGGGNFDGKTLTDYETFYNGPDNSIKGMRITWLENGKKHTESFKFKRKKRLFVIPLLFPLF